MKLKDLSRLRKCIMPLLFVLILTAFGIVITADESQGGILRKIDFRQIYIQPLEEEGIELVEADPGEELELILIKAEVLSLAAAAKGSQAISEAFVYVKNQGQIGEDVVACFMPDSVNEIFSTALNNKFTIQIWGIEMPTPTEYSAMTTKSFIVFAARVLRDDVPSEFNNLGIFYEAGLPRPTGELVEIKTEY